MRVEVNLRNTPIDLVAETSRRLEDRGVDRLADGDIRREPLLIMAVAATVTSRIELSTAVSLAFTRSPVALAYQARHLSDISSGRFRLGVGTQVRGHIERRFGMPWHAPLRRMRDYLQAMTAVTTSWQTGEPLAHDGEFYTLSLMPPEFNPGTSTYGVVPVDLAAVNPGMVRLAARLCQGVRLHPFITPEYVRHVIRPALEAGAESRDGLPDAFDICGGGFLATGPDEAAVARQREWVRSRVAFYSSTTAYLPVLEVHDMVELHGQTSALVKSGRWEDLTACVTDEVLDLFCTTGTYTQLADAFAGRYAGLVRTVQLQAPAPEEIDDAFGTLVATLQEAAS